MSTKYSRNFLVNDLLNRICEKLQIDTTRRERAVQSYETVNDFLKRSESIFRDYDIDIFPQGSFAILTTVKPISGDDYDVDYVLTVKLPPNVDRTPVNLLSELERVLKSSDRYKSICEKKNRCIRLNYKSDFHMDILPSIPDYRSTNGDILIPDRETKSWIESNPRGFISWFETKAKQQILFEERAVEEEPLPDELPYESKPPLIRAVQLMKRYRDVQFEKSVEKGPRSIILTALAGYLYESDRTTFGTLNQILVKANNLLATNRIPFKIPNPTNTNENFAEEWIESSSKYDEFNGYLTSLSATWRAIESEISIDKVAKLLSSVFGETISSQALNEQREFVERQSRTASYQAPIVTIASPAKPWQSS